MKPQKLNALLCDKIQVVATDIADILLTDMDLLICQYQYIRQKFTRNEPSPFCELGCYRQFKINKTGKVLMKIPLVCFDQDDSPCVEILKHKLGGLEQITQKTYKEIIS